MYKLIRYVEEVIEDGILYDRTRGADQSARIIASLAFLNVSPSVLRQSLLCSTARAMYDTQWAHTLLSQKVTYSWLPD